MLSRIKSLRISVKLTLVYAVLMAVLLFVTTACTTIGLYYTQYHQVERELSFSIRYVLDQLKKNYATVEENVSAELPLPPPVDAQKLHNGLKHDMIEHGNGFGGMGGALGAGRRFKAMQQETDWASKLDFGLMPGVFLKIADSSGNVIYDSDRYSPVLTMLTAHIRENPPLWANPNFEVIETGNFIIYYKEVPVSLNGEAYVLHFFKTITTENRMLEIIQNLLLAEMLLGIVAALLFGYLVSRRMLKPVRDLTATAKSIEISDLSTRIQVSPAKDELSELAETFNHMLGRIQKGFKQQQQFVSDASHELRTPVTVIKGYSDMLSRWGKQDAETLQEGLEAISSEAEDMQELIEKLLFLARADQKRQIINKEPLDMQPLIEDVFKKMQLTDAEHEYELNANAAAMVLADKVTIKQMLRIFLENAMKYTPAGGKITLSSHVLHDDVLELSIADTGIGIAAEEQDKIFGRFYRADTARTKKAGAGGTGLGLSIAKWIADEHNIKIAVESEIDKGTIFTLYIPIIQA